MGFGSGIFAGCTCPHDCQDMGCDTGYYYNLPERSHALHDFFSRQDGGSFEGAYLERLPLSKDILDAAIAHLAAHEPDSQKRDDGIYTLQHIISLLPKGRAFYEPSC